MGRPKGKGIKRAEIICGIYCITNLVNDKKYIGQSVDIYSRWKGHKCELNKNGHGNILLQYSWNKYGAENFEFKIIEKCERDILDIREVYFIEYYNTFCDRKMGYNLDTGGTSKRILSKWSKNRTSKLRTTQMILQLDMEGNILNKWVSSGEAGRQTGFDRAAIDKCCKGQYNMYKNYFWVYPDNYDSFILTIPDVKEKFNSRPLVQISTEGEFIREWDSPVSACKSLKFKEGVLGNCLLKNKKSYKGYIWVYKHDYDSKEFDIEFYKDSKPVSVVQFTMEGEFIREFDSIADVISITGIANISGCCLGTKEFSGGYKWMHKSDYDEHGFVDVFVNKKRKSVIQLTLDNVFVKEWDMIITASKAFNMSKSCIQDCCKKRQKTSKGFRWMYKEEYIQLNNTVIKEAI